MGVRDGVGGGEGSGEGSSDGDGLGSADGEGLGEGGGGGGGGAATDGVTLWPVKSGVGKSSTSPGSIGIAAIMKSCQISAGIVPP